MILNTEKQIIDFIKLKTNNTFIGDDVAIFNCSDKGKIAISTDSMVEGTHFDFKYITPELLGKKSVLRACSDLYASNILPEYIMLNINLPVKYLNSGNIHKILTGIIQETKRYNIEIIGGDTTKSKNLSITITVLSSGISHYTSRVSAKPDDIICMTGTVGNKKYLFDNYLKQNKLTKNILNLYHKVPRYYKLIKSLYNKPYINAMIDISDGLIIDLKHILNMSDVGADIFLDKIPLSYYLKRTKNMDSLDKIKIAVSSGDEYQLLFTVNRYRINKLKKIFKILKIRLTEIGFIQKKKEIHFYYNDKRMVNFQENAYKHF